MFDVCLSVFISLLGQVGTLSWWVIFRWSNYEDDFISSMLACIVCWGSSRYWLDLVPCFTAAVLWFKNAGNCTIWRHFYFTHNKLSWKVQTDKVHPKFCSGQTSKNLVSLTEESVGHICQCSLGWTCPRCSGTDWLVFIFTRNYCQMFSYIACSYQ